MSMVQDMTFDETSSDETDPEIAQGDNYINTTQYRETVE